MPRNFVSILPFIIRMLAPSTRDSRLSISSRNAWALADILSASETSTEDSSSFEVPLSSFARPSKVPSGLPAEAVPAALPLMAR